MATRTTLLATLSLMCLTPVRGAAQAATDGSVTGCGLLATTIENADTAFCLSCHSGKGAPNASQHPVDVHYGWAARGRSGGMGLRPEDEVVRRGVFLPEGQLMCVTCHDARSPWKYHLALPPGSKVEPEVDVADPSTYEDGPRLVALNAALQRPNPRERLAVDPKPLCLACHAAD